MDILLTPSFPEPEFWQSSIKKYGQATQFEEILPLTDMVIECLGNLTQEAAPSCPADFWTLVNRVYVLARLEQKDDFITKIYNATLPFFCFLPTDIFLPNYNTPANTLVLSQIPYFDSNLNPMWPDGRKALSKCLSDTEVSSDPQPGIEQNDFKVLYEWIRTKKWIEQEPYTLNLLIINLDYLFGCIEEAPPELVRLILDNYKKVITPDNAVGAYICASTHRIEELRQFCIQTWVNHINSLEDIFYLENMFLRHPHRERLIQDDVLKKVIAGISPASIDLLAVPVKAPSQWLNLEHQLEMHPRLMEAVRSKIHFSVGVFPSLDARKAYLCAVQFNLSQWRPVLLPSIMPLLTDDFAFAIAENPNGWVELEDILPEDRRQYCLDHLISRLSNWFVDLENKWDPKRINKGISITRSEPSATVSAAVANIRRLEQLLGSITSLPNPCCADMSLEALTWLLEKLSPTCSTLNLSGTPLNDLSLLERFETLDTLILSHCNQLVSLRRLQNAAPYLRVLDLSHSSVEWNSADLGRKTWLTHVNLEKTPTYSLHGLEKFKQLQWVNAQRCPCPSLDLEGITILTDLAPAQ